MTARVLGLLAILAVVGAAPAAASARTGGAERSAASRLKPFSSCPSLVRYARANALRTGAVGGIAPLPVSPVPVSRPDGDVQAEARTAPQDFSTTNVQEAGVDEPDLVKTDGERIFAVAGNALHAVDARGDTPRRLGSLTLGESAGSELLLHEGRALVISQAFSGGPEPVRPGAPEIAQPVTTLTEVDVRDPRAMRLVRTLKAEGAYVSARLNGATARVVLTSPPELGTVTPAAIRASKLDAWLPGGVVTTRRTGRRRGRHLVECSAIRRPRTFSGLGMLTVLTVDMARGLPWVDSDAVMTDAQTVYGSPAGLYVATQRWLDPTTPIEDLPTSSTTQIHRFDATDARSTTYRATGEVRGYLLNQFSLSEHDGVLRVASTETPVLEGGEERRESESFVTMLDDGLRPIGVVGGLGRGERIHSVRFIGDRGYVVTFRQTDPLYTLDLAQPRTPRVAGELKLLGYSAYLHPLGDGRLLGVGQDATAEGRTTGTQLSLFDVSDAAAPVRLHQRTIASSSSEAEIDHRAFLHWPPTSLAVLPVQTESFAGAVGFRLDPAAGIAELRRVQHPGDAPIRRALVVGDRLFTLSDGGLEAGNLTDLAPQAWVPLPRSGP